MDAVEQQGVAVQQVAVVAFGNGVYSATTTDTIPPEPSSAGVPSSRANQRPSSPPSSASSESLTEAALRAELAAAEAKAAGAAPAPSPATPSGSASLSFDEMSEQIAAKTFITHTARPIQGDPEATLQKLLRMRDDALDPPATVADLAIATAAAIRINRLVQDRYAAEQAAAAGGPPPSSRRTLPPAGFKA